MPTARLGCAAAMVGGALLVFGGHGTARSALTAVERFCFEAWHWEHVLALPTPRMGCVALVCSSHSGLLPDDVRAEFVCVLGGHNGEGAVAAADALQDGAGRLCRWLPMPSMLTPRYASGGAIIAW